MILVIHDVFAVFSGERCAEFVGQARVGRLDILVLLDSGQRTQVAVGGLAIMPAAPLPPEQSPLLTETRS